MELHDESTNMPHEYFTLDDLYVSEESGDIRINIGKAVILPLLQK